MSLIEKKIKNIASAGSACLACDDRIAKGEKAVEVSFDIPVGFMGSVSVTKEAHLICAEELAQVIKKRLSEAGWK